MNTQQIVDKVILAERSQPRKRSGKFSPSSFGTCFRRQYWQRHGEEETNPPDDRNLRVFKCGYLFEKFILDCLKDEQIQKQVLIEEEDVKGYADIVDEDSVADVKSQHSRSFWWMAKSTKTGKSIVDEKINNFLQVGYYALRLGKEFIRMIYVSKDDLCIEEFKVPLAVVKDRVEEELKTLRYYWGLKTLPPPQPRAFGTKDGKPNECEKYCPYRDKCYKLEGKETTNKRRVRWVSEKTSPSVTVSS